MQRGYIKIREVLQWLWNPANRNIPFQISFCSLDIKRDTGGEFIELASAIRPTREAITENLGKADRPPLKSIEQNRLANATFNVYVKERNRFYSVHNDLILFFNRQRVVY
jgi:hypothetical protein